jgi:cytochrome b pre-mRNA-processing protein 3
MIFDLFRFRVKQQRDEYDLAVYTRLVQQARHPALFTILHVPDTLDGRYEMVVLHVYLLWQRLRKAPPPYNQLGQRIFDMMIRDMDSALREMGVGDLSVAKKMKPMVEIFYGRTRAYDQALEQSDENALVAALQRNIYADQQANASEARQCAQYIRNSVVHLATIPDEEFGKSMILFSPLPPINKDII